MSGSEKRSLRGFRRRVTEIESPSRMAVSVSSWSSALISAIRLEVVRGALSLGKKSWRIAVSIMVRPRRMTWARHVLCDSGRVGR